MSGSTSARSCPRRPRTTDPGVIDEPTRRVDDGALRALVPRVLAGLVRRGEDFDGAEDALQEALLEALRVWPEHPPRDPRPTLGRMALRKVHRRDVEAMSEQLLADGLAPKTVANTLKILHGVFEQAIDLEWTHDNPVRRAARPRHVRDTDPDLRFLTVEELEAVLRAIPDQVVVREPKPHRAGRAGPSNPPPPDVLGPVLRVLVLTAAMTGLRQGELLALRWRDVDWPIQRVRVRQTWRRTEFSHRGKSDLSTRRSVPLADRLVAELDAWSRRSLYAHDDDLVFGHPQLCASCASTTCATPSPPAWPPTAPRCAPSRTSSATPTPRPPRSTRTTPPASTKSPWSTTPSPSTSRPRAPTTPGSPGSSRAGGPAAAAAPDGPRAPRVSTITGFPYS